MHDELRRRCDSHRDGVKMINFRQTRFVTSASSFIDRPQDVIKEIVFIGRSNVGKSSLLNALCDQKHLAFTSSKPGHTKLLNYFQLAEGIYFVDAPGYGYHASGKENTIRFGKMMEDYFANCQTLKGVIFLLDSRRVPQEEDISFLSWVESLQIPYYLVLTKCDKLNQKEKAAMMRNIKSAFPQLEQEKILVTSILQKNTLLPLQEAICTLLK